MNPANEALRKTITRYGDHDKDCRSLHAMVRLKDSTVYPCSCGWNHARQTALVALAEPGPDSVLVPTWIPVTERLPGHTLEVLMVDGGYVAYGHYEFSGDMEGFHICNAGYDGDSAPADNVTHWMPLPAPPTNDRP